MHGELRLLFGRERAYGNRQRSWGLHSKCLRVKQLAWPRATAVERCLQVGTHSTESPPHPLVPVLVPPPCSQAHPGSTCCPPGGKEERHLPGVHAEVRPWSSTPGATLAFVTSQEVRLTAVCGPGSGASRRPESHPKGQRATGPSRREPGLGSPPNIQVGRAHHEEGQEEKI